MRSFVQANRLWSCALLAFSLGIPTTLSAAESGAAPVRAAADYGDLPLSFEANQGQTDARVRFISRGDGYTFFLTPSEAVLAFSKNESAQVSVLHMRLTGANTDTQISGIEALPGVSNYFSGSDPNQWRTGVPTYRKVAYENIYRGINLVYYGNQRQMEYDFIVAPGADPRDIRLSIEGSRKLMVDSEGNLVLQAAGGDVRLLAPRIYQDSKDHGQRKQIAGKWKLYGKNIAGFHLAAYDHSKALVIDPVLMYSSFLGGSQKSSLKKIAIDAEGNAYVAGFTASGDFPAAPTPLANTFGGGPASRGAFIAKIDPTGANLLYSTYLSGSVDEEATGLAVDASGNVYVTGTTHSADFPVRNAFQSACALSSAGECSDAFLTKISPTGDSLIYSTYLGGSGADSATGLSVDTKGNAYVTGATSSTDFPITPEALQSKCGGACTQNAFLAKFDASGEKLSYATYLGGSGSDTTTDIAIDASGNAYLTGQTTSADFPVTSAFQKICAADIAKPNACIGTAFVAKIKADGSVLAYSTFLGGSSGSMASGIAVDATGSAYVTGSTQSADFPVMKAFQKSCGVDAVSGQCSLDIFLTKFSPNGKSLVYSTYLGGAARDEASSIAVDGKGNAYLAGHTESKDFPTARALQPKLNGVSDAFVAQFDAAGKSLSFSTFHGGSSTEAGYGLALDGKGNVYITGETASTDFPTHHPFQSSCAGGCASAFVSKMTVPSPQSPPTIVKSFGVASIPLNGSTSLSFTINNPNPAVDLTGVSFTDNFPSGIVVSTPNGLTGSCDPGTITATAGSGAVTLVGATVVANDSCTFSVNVTGVTAGTATNTTDPITSNEGGTGGTASASLDVEAPPSIAKAFSPTTIAVNATTSLTFTITNPSANVDALTGVTFSDTLPTGLTVANASATVCGGTLTTTAPTGIALSGVTIALSGQCQFSVTVTGTASGSYTNTTGNVSSTNGGTGNTATANLTVAGAPAITKSFGALHIALNGKTSLTFDISNPNTGSSLTGVAFTDTLPAGLVVSTPNALSNTCGGTVTATAGSGSVSLSGTTLAGSASCTLSVNVTGTTAGVKNNSVTVSSTNGGTGNTSNASVTVTGPPALVKAFGAASIPLNGSTSLSFTVTNPNTTVAITGVAFTDNLPAGLVVSTPNGLTGSCGPGTITATAGASTLDLSGATVAASDSCTFSVNVTGTTAGNQNNTTGSISSANGGTGGTASASIQVVAPPSIAKAFNPIKIGQNATTSLTFTITNPAANAVALTGVAFTDTLPTGLTVANASATVCGGTLTTTAPTGIALTGATIAANSQCQFSVTVTGATSGNYTNTTGNVTSTNGGTGNTASANLTVADPPSIVKAFGATNLTLNASTSLTFTIANPNSGLALTNVSFTDSLPAGLVVATPNNLSTTCSGTSTAAAGASSVSLAGATVAASGSCTVSVNVTGTTAGVKNNSVTVTSTNGGTGNTSTATVTVGDYTLSVAVGTPVVIQGSNSTPATLTATPASGYTGTIMPATTTCTPAGFSCTFTNFPLPGGGTNGSADAPISVAVAPATTVGNYNLTLNVTDSNNPSVSHNVPFSLAVECMFSLTSATFAPQTTTAAAAYSVTVTETQGGTVCPWTAAASGNAGVTITSGSGSTDTAVNTGNPVSFQVAPNVSNAAENGRITVNYFAAPVNPGTSILSVTQEASATAPDVIAGGDTEINVTVTQTGARAASITFNSVCGALDTNDNPDPLGNNFGITCSAPTTDLPLAAGATIPITINVPATATAHLQPQPGRNLFAPFYALGFAIPGIVFLGLGAGIFGGKKRHGLMRLMGLLLAVSMIALLAGCGGGFHALVVPKGNPNNFTLTVMGTVSDGSGGTGNVTGIEIYTIAVHVTPQI